jgi:tetratricopeptide (TPR) repeat protein
MSEIKPVRRAQRAVGPRLRWLLIAVLALFTLLAVNSAYLGLITLLEWLNGQTYQDYTYQLMFLFHLLVGLLFVLPALVFIGAHMRNTWRRPNRRAVYAGLGLFGAVLILLLSGVLLVRFEGFDLDLPALRETAYWLHIAAPLACLWLFVLHRLAGPRIRWRAGFGVAAVGLLFAGGMALLQLQDPREWNQVGRTGVADFTPALVRSATGNNIPAQTLMRDGYCKECHAEAHEQWSQSVHRFASFNNPVYLMSVRNTREVMLKRDGDVRGARFCAGCHDLVPLLSGAFDDPDFDDVNHPTAHAGITCTSCHAITNINSVRGNADFTIEEPIHYPFAFSENLWLSGLSRQLVKANPGFHQKTFLKPLHRSAEFCGSCHKVNLPQTLNHYKWLRGQNHYDSFRLSGVSGHGVTSFYYPPMAKANCAGCHMPLQASTDFAARDFDGSGQRSIHRHDFAAANTALPFLLGLDQKGIENRREMLRSALRVDLMGVREGERIDDPLIAPLRPEVPALLPGRSYLLEIVVRTTGMGHSFTEGTADSNEVWVEVRAEHQGRLIAHSGGLDPQTQEVDPWSHFINAYVLDRHGNRIDRRNAEDIFIPLYNHQIPPGAADLLHYRLDVPADAAGEIKVNVRVHYRKFDTTLMRHVDSKRYHSNPLPIITLAEDQLLFPVGADAAPITVADSAIPQWQRWNDFGIGALRKPERRQLRQAEEAFTQVEALGRGDGALNLARVYLEEGRLPEAAQALDRASRAAEAPAPWSLAWFGAMVLKQEGQLPQALEALNGLVENRFPGARERGFDFSRDNRLLDELGLTWMELAKRARGEAAADQRKSALTQARDWFERSLVQDPENASAHYNLGQIYKQLGDDKLATFHGELHATYKVDENARDQAISAARARDEAARHAADAVVIYDLQRAGGAGYAQPVVEWMPGQEQAP